MENLALVIVVAVVAGSILALWACCALAGKCSREEEKEDGK